MWILFGVCARTGYVCVVYHCAVNWMEVNVLLSVRRTTKDHLAMQKPLSHHEMCVFYRECG